MVGGGMGGGIRVMVCVVVWDGAFGGGGMGVGMGVVVWCGSTGVVVWGW